MTKISDDRGRLKQRHLLARGWELLIWACCLYSAISSMYYRQLSRALRRELQEQRQAQHHPGEQLTPTLSAEWPLRERLAEANDKSVDHCNDR